MVSSKIKTALKLSLQFWLLGVIFLVPFVFFGFNVLTGIKLSVIATPIITFFLSRVYLGNINSNRIKEGFLFGMILAATHIPADFLFITLFISKGLLLFSSYWPVLLYGEMVLFSAIAGMGATKSA